MQLPIYTLGYSAHQAASTDTFTVSDWHAAANDILFFDVECRFHTGRVPQHLHAIGRLLRSIQ